MENLKHLYIKNIDREIVNHLRPLEMDKKETNAGTFFKREKKRWELIL